MLMDIFGTCHPLHFLCNHIKIHYTVDLMDGLYVCGLHTNLELGKSRPECGKQIHFFFI